MDQSPFTSLAAHFQTGTAPSKNASLQSRATRYPGQIRHPQSVEIQSPRCNARSPVSAILNVTRSEVGELGSKQPRHFSRFLWGRILRMVPSTSDCQEDGRVDSRYL